MSALLPQIRSKDDVRNFFIAFRKYSSTENLLNDMFSACRFRSGISFFVLLLGFLSIILLLRPVTPPIRAPCRRWRASLGVRKKEILTSHVGGGYFIFAPYGH